MKPKAKVHYVTTETWLWTKCDQLVRTRRGKRRRITSQELASVTCADCLRMIENAAKPAIRQALREQRESGRGE